MCLSGRDSERERKIAESENQKVIKGQRSRERKRKTERQREIE